ncbi:Nucleoporin NDC1 like protein [Verticillium longisporum]|uniref:Nucleoporin NDC1 like protein n=1 Tax=Verticillium longisporum TaxID=100787 RepID=A0A8I3A0E4_VERLO|nr:Nucleoporin NDC1 like protein [Verticillium longisporum]
MAPLLWSWFPIGPVGIRTLFLFASALTVIILRISQYHVGTRASTSAISGALPNLITIQALEAWVAYTISSALFGLVFLWSASANSKLNWISTMSGDRGRLNERPVFLSFYLLVAATFQAIMHIICDTDRITIDVNKARNSPVTNGGATSTTPLTVLLTKLPGVVANAVMRAIGVYALAVTLYSTIFRGAAWSWAMAFFRPFNNLPKSNMLPVDWPCLGLEYLMGHPPLYAILSHTEGEDEFVFDDYQEGFQAQQAAPKPGLRMVLTACRRASQDGFGYVWVDTCVVDKSSSAELSEAINSMFRWY